MLIIEASGRVAKAKGVLTIAVTKMFENKIFKVFFGLGMIVWDVFILQGIQFMLPSLACSKQ